MLPGASRSFPALPGASRRAAGAARLSCATVRWSTPPPPRVRNKVKGSKKTSLFGSILSLYPLLVLNKLLAWYYNITSELHYKNLYYHTNKIEMCVCLYQCPSVCLCVCLFKCLLRLGERINGHAKFYLEVVWECQRNTK